MKVVSKYLRQTDFEIGGAEAIQKLQAFVARRPQELFFGTDGSQHQQQS